MAAAVLWHDELATQLADITSLPVDQSLKALKLKVVAQRHAAAAREVERMGLPPETAKAGDSK